MYSPLTAAPPQFTTRLRHNPSSEVLILSPKPQTPSRHLGFAKLTAPRRRSPNFLTMAQIPVQTLHRDSQLLYVTPPH